MSKTLNIENERKAFLGIYKYYSSAINFSFDVENECFVLSKKNPQDHEVKTMSQMNQQWGAWLRRAKLEYKKLDGCVVVPVEPTEEMAHAFEKGMLESEHFFGEFEAFNDGYKAMVEAARGGNHE